MTGKLAGEKNPMYGVHRFGKDAANYKDGRTHERTCSHCNKNKIKNFYADICRSCSSTINNKKWHAKNPGMYSGKNNPNYNPNKHFRPYPLGWTKTFREQIRFRDNYKCQNCGKPEIECKHKLHIHHIDYDKDNLELTNLISICNSCHAKTASVSIHKRVFWIKYYKDLVNDRTLK